MLSGCHLVFAQAASHFEKIKMLQLPRVTFDPTLPYLVQRLKPYMDPLQYDPNKRKERANGSPLLKVIFFFKTEDKK